MNINLKLSLPLIDSDGNEKNIKIDSDLFLFPFYAVESDITSSFPSVREEDIKFIRQSIHNASMQVDRNTSLIEAKQLLSTKELFSLKRDYVICLVINETAKRLNSDQVKKVSKSKSLGDFSVSTSSDAGDNLILKKVFEDSNNCIEELNKLISDAEQDLILPVDFIKGRSNARNFQSSGRLWWLRDDGVIFRVIDGYASTKYWFNGNRYKTGTLNTYTLSDSNSTISKYVGTLTNTGDDSEE